MAFGWSSGDLVTLAKLCYETYSFCRTAPAELQGLSNRLDKMGRKLDRLKTILDKSGLETFKEAHALEQHLLDAKAHLKPLLSATNRAKGLTQLALNQGKLRRIEKNLDADEREIDEMKIDLILECSLRNMRYDNDFQLGLFNPGPSSGPTNETINLIDEISPVSVITSTVPLSSEAVQSRIRLTTVSDAGKALMMAMRLRSQPSSEAEAVRINDVAPKGSLGNDFVTEFVSLAEETELYSKDADPTQNLERLTEITEKATHFRQALHSLSASSRTDTAQYQLPTSDGIRADSFGREFFGHLSSMSDDASMRRWSFDHIQSNQSGFSLTSAMEHQTTPSRSHSDPILSNESPLQGHSRDDDSTVRMSTADAVIQLDNEPSTKEQINLRERSKVSLTMDPKASLNCSFDFEVSEGSVLLKVIPTDGPHGTPDAVVASGALLPPSRSSSLKRSQCMMSHGALSRSFQHFFPSRDRPIPHFLHPDVEGPTEEPDAPYTITFTERQYIYMEDASEGPRWTTSLMYIFHEKQDQITLCERIFGKTLLMSAGSDKINYDGREISHMSAIALWLDDASGTRSMTFFPNLTGTGKTATPKDMELVIDGLWDPNKASRNPNALAVVAELMPRDDKCLNVSARPDRRSSLHQSGGTFLSKASSAPSQKRQKSGKLKCTIRFTRSSDRASFLSHLK